VLAAHHELCHDISCSDYVTYFEAKQSATAYQAAKQALTADGAPFEGWKKSGEEWESFDEAGNHLPHKKRSIL
jgi:hypothetical protein